MNRRLLLPLGVLTLSVLAYAAQGVVLKRTPRVGDKANYAIKGTMNVQSLGAEVTLSGSSTEEVTQVDGEKYTTKSVTKMKGNVAGQEVPLSDGDEEETTTLLDGTFVGSKAGEHDASSTDTRIDRLLTLFLSAKSVEKDEAWTYEGKHDDKLDIPALKITYKFVGEEKVDQWDTYKISGEGAETEGSLPAKIKTIYWIDKANGGVVKSHAEFTDAVFDPEIGVVSGSMDITRKD